MPTNAEISEKVRKRYLKLLEKRELTDIAPLSLVFEEKRPEQTDEIVVSPIEQTEIGNTSFVRIYGAIEKIAQIVNEANASDQKPKALIKEHFDDVLNRVIDMAYDASRAQYRTNETAQNFCTLGEDFKSTFTWEKNNHDRNFIDDIDHNCGIPINSEYSSYEEFNNDLRPLLAREIGCSEADIIITPDRTHSHYLFTVSSDIASPCISLNEAYRAYRTSEEEDSYVMNTIVAEIIAHYRDLATNIPEPVKNLDVKKMLSYNEIKNDILPFIDIAGPEFVQIRNDLCDFDIIFKYIPDRNNNGDIYGIDTTIPITNEMIEEWGISATELCLKAMDNLEKSHISIANLEKICDDAAFKDFHVCYNPLSPLYSENVRNECLKIVGGDVAFLFTSSAEVLFFKSTPENINKILPVVAKAKQDDPLMGKGYAINSDGEVGNLVLNDEMEEIDF